MTANTPSPNTQQKNDITHNRYTHTTTLHPSHDTAVKRKMDRSLMPTFSFPTSRLRSLNLPCLLCFSYVSVSVYFCVLGKGNERKEAKKEKVMIKISELDMHTSTSSKHRIIIPTYLPTSFTAAQKRCANTWVDTRY